MAITIKYFAGSGSRVFNTLVGSGVKPQRNLFVCYKIHPLDLDC